MSGPGACQGAEEEPPCHVLLVEDDECTLRMVAAMLRHCDYKVTLARNGREALEVLEGPDSEHIDMILTDILMPEVSGMELISEVVRGGKFQDLPIIVMSSESREEVVSQALQAGATEYLVKPIRRRELSTLWQHVHSSPTGSGASIPAAQPAPGPSREVHSARQDAAEQEPANVQPAVAAAAAQSPPDIEMATEAVVASAANSSTTAATAAKPSSVPNGAASTFLNIWPLNGVLPATSFVRQVSQHLEASMAPNVASSVDLEIKPLDLTPHSPTRQRRASVDMTSLEQQEEALNGDAPRRSASNPLDEMNKRLDESFSKLHHSRSASAFSSFTSVVPRPCARGDDAAMQHASQPWGSEGTSSTVSRPVEAAMASWQAIGPLILAPQAASLAGQDMQQQQQQHLQQQKFFDAFQAAVDQHTGLGSGEAGRECCTANRKAAIVKFREKRKARNFEKKVRYESRRRLAEARPRVRGQFVRADQVAAHLSEAAEMLAA